MIQLNHIAGQAGIGVQDLVEERANGIKSRGVYETPGGTLLHTAIKALRHLCWDRSLLTTARALAIEYGECVYDGLWHTDLHQALEAFFQKAAETLCGTVQLKLENGGFRVVGRQSVFSLYAGHTVTFESDEEGIHHLADGFCKITALKQRQLGRRDLLTGRLAP
jgi:argininosuccinate synthase